jgi:hypothetical protein
MRVEEREKEPCAWRRERRGSRVLGEGATRWKGRRGERCRLREFFLG